MTLDDQENGFVATIPPPPPPHSKLKQRRKSAIICLATLLLVIILLALLVFILGVTAFSVREPRTQLVSASLEGVSPKLSFPMIKIELNITLNLTLLVQNRNRFASFKSGPGRTVLLYQGNQVGQAQVDPGLIPAKGTATLYSILTLELDRFAQPSGLESLVRDVMAGELAMEAKTRIPGRVKLLGVFRKHMVSNSDCQFVFGFPDLKIKSQDCKNHNKL